MDDYKLYDFTLLTQYSSHAVENTKLNVYGGGESDGRHNCPHPLSQLGVLDQTPAKPSTSKTIMLGAAGIIIIIKSRKECIDG